MGSIVTSTVTRPIILSTAEIIEEECLTSKQLRMRTVKKQVTEAGKTFVLCFKHKWLKDNSWHVYNKELKGGLCKVCILFDKVDEVNRGIFVKRAYQDLKKPEKILEHAQPKYHNDTMIRAQQFIDSYENPTENIDYDPNMQTRCDKNIQILMRIIDTVHICARQEIALRKYRDNLDDRLFKIVTSLQS